jgi:hypothetical protein
MRLPVRHISGNLIWTTSASVWGVWRVESDNYAHASRETKRERLDQLESLFKALRGEVLLLSLCPQVDAASVVDRMTSGVDLDKSPELVELSWKVLDQLEELKLTSRVDFLVLPLSHADFKESLRAVGASAASEVMSSLGLLPPAVTADEVAHRTTQARRLAATWPSGVRLRPASEAEILWIYAHSARRGLEEPLLPEDGAPRGIRGRGRTVAAHTQVLLDEGGRGQQSSKTPTNPVKRKYLRAETEYGSSFQSFCVMSEMPDSFVFPGSEYLSALDEFSFPVDWCVRLNIESGAKALSKSRRRANELAHQYTEYDGDVAGVPAHLDKDTSSLDEFVSRLTTSSTEVEIRASVAMCVWGDSPADLNEQMSALRNHFGGSDYTLARPAGDQVNLFHAMLPGARNPRVMNDYAQILLARDFAMAMPFSGQGLGDDAGSLFGLQLSGGGVRPVLLDFSHGPRVNVAANGAFIGELGSGKSVGLKSALYSILSTGHRLARDASRGRGLVIDRTPQREWVRFVEACPGTTQVIDVDESAGLSLDPLRVFTGPRAARYAESFLTPLLDIASMSVEGVTLADAIEATNTSANRSMSGLIDTLVERARTTDPDEPNDAAVRAAASELVRKLRSLAKKDLGRVIFDLNLPVVRVSDADSIVFAVSSLKLPTKEELDEHRLSRLEVEKKFGWRLMYLVAALCREIAFLSEDEFTGVFFDECWWLSSSPEGLDLMLEIVRDGRKHNAGLFAASHDPYDIGPDNEAGEKIRGLITHVMVFRQRSRQLAARALEFLGLDGTDATMLKIITENLSPVNVSDHERAIRAGECLYRDLKRRIGGMKVLIPADEQAADAIHTTPGELVLVKGRS